MNRRIIAIGIIGATLIGVSEVRAGVTQCNPGGVYIGGAIGCGFHKARMKVKQRSVSKSIEEQLKGLNAQAEAYKKVEAAAKAAEEAATKTKTEKEKEVVDKVTDKIVETIGLKYEFTGDIWTVETEPTDPEDLADGNPLKSIIEAAIRTCGEIPVTVDHDHEDDEDYDEFTNYATKYNEFLKAEINKEVTKAIQGQSTLLDTKNMKIVYKEDVSVDMTAEMKAAYTAYTTAAAAADKAAKEHTESTTRYSNFVKEYEKIKGAKEIFEALAKENGVKKETERIVALERTELGASSSGRVSKSKSGFIGEILGGYNHRVGDGIFGIEINGGFDTYKATIKDKVPAVTDNTAKKGVTIKARHFFGIRGTAGFFCTTNARVEGVIGVQGTGYKVDTTGLPVIYNHKSIVSTIGNAMNTFNTTNIADTDKAITAAKDDSDKKKEAEALKKIYENVPAVPVSQTDEEKATQLKVHKKTAFAPVFGLRVVFDISDNVAIFVGWEYIPSKKIVGVDKTGVVEIKDQRHAIKTGVVGKF